MAEISWDVMLAALWAVGTLLLLCIGTVGVVITFLVIKGLATGEYIRERPN